MTSIQQKRQELKSDIRRFEFQLQRWKNVRSVLISCKRENLEPPKGFKHQAELALVYVVAIRQSLRVKRQQYDIEYLESKMEKYVAAEQYEKAVPLRDRILFLKQYI